ncbi:MULTISPECIES: M3 family metallopeptidase [unclassified Apibacter]|uniref:M3 family metallopeptidase n=1 Tax=unclassified Apibacter TaxID=2630820 RepID=UPI00132585AB|nr:MULTISPECIES: M3 family metallopeptidase [unclassified Apibacter]MCX8677595.1 M3 family metallopeptidase [Apibacter sp. B3919]MXO24201.1 M3 family peptidase [Apibacter sp. B3924]MXO26990.1 M3 family peptidase [Apibacter sp. B3813]MXO28882.1 M3 family peptidase [Apibacter sp. B3913]MXO30833.1 M3 family peptidase [Apibacter sp. B3912]
MSNNLVEKFNTPYESIPFENIKQEDFKPAIEQAIEDAKNEINEIVQNTDPPNFVNTIVALENVGKKLTIISSTFFNLNSAETNDYLQSLAEEISPMLTEYANDIILNEQLFEKIKIVYDTTLKSKLSQEEVRLLDKTYKDFSKNGALLSSEDKNNLRQISNELAILSVKFGQNVLKETNDYFLHISESKDMEGIPESIKEMAKQEAENRNLKGWVFTLHYPSYVPFITYSANRELRKEIYTAYMQRACKDNEYNNEDIIHKIVELRSKKAKLLGFKTYADLILQERMASAPKLVYDFLYDLLHKAKPFAQKEIQDLKNIASRDGITEMMPYDHAFYAEKLRQEKFSFSEEELKPYFPLHQVLNAAFDVAKKLYGLTFIEREDIQKYHSEVKVYEVFNDKGKHQALLYTDFFPREGKRAGAWMTSYKGQFKTLSDNIRPHISIVCNFSRPNGEIPSLLTFSEVTTLFHEFGHALHGILANTTFESLSGTNVYWDFVELPSQFMENYVFEKEFLKTFALHYQKGDMLDEEKIDKIVASANFMQGYQTLRQIGLGLLDMAYHTDELTSDQGIEDFEVEKIKETQLYPHIKNTCISTSFSHIFQGGYAAGYYSYKWAEVLDADAFDYFKERGIFDKETASKFESLLSKGGTEDPMELYISFRGRRPQSEALLKRAGLLANTN